MDIFMPFESMSLKKNVNDLFPPPPPTPAAAESHFFNN